MNIAADFNDWRDKKIMPGEYPDWDKLTFTYPADSGFVVMKDSSGKWLLDNKSLPDSTSVINTIKNLSNQNYGTFVNKFDTNGKQALFILKVEGRGFNPAIIKAYAADTTNKYAITSTLDPGSFFSGKAGDMFRNIFPAKISFL